MLNVFTSFLLMGAFVSKDIRMEKNGRIKKMEERGKNLNCRDSCFVHSIVHILHPS